MRFTIQTKLFLSHFTAIILVSGSVGSYFYHSAADSLMEALRSRLRNSAALISQGFTARDLDSIRTATDMKKASYKEKVAVLRDYVKANPDIAFIYVMRKVGDGAEFVLDSDIQDPAEPGEPYTPNLPKLMEGFLRPSVDRNITSDRWGYFLSGYSPLEQGEDDYLIGIDMRADEVQKKFEQIRLAGMLSLALSVILAMIFSRLLSQNMTRRITELATRFAQVAPVGTQHNEAGSGDELDQLATAFSQMSQRLEIEKQQVDLSQSALRKAHDELENRVEARTMELVQANKNLLQEIVERKHVERMLEETSRIDYLTGVLNRRAMSKRLEQMISQTERWGHGFCLILTDIDHFKQVNDRYGHDVGDKVLKHTVDRLRKHVREADELARWGGEEFLLLSPETQLNEATSLAARLCRDLAETEFAVDGQHLRVTASFGVTLYRPGEPLDTCLKRADDALYTAKDQGRNQVVVANV